MYSIVFPATSVLRARAVINRASFDLEFMSIITPPMLILPLPIALISTMNGRDEQTNNTDLIFLRSTYVNHVNQAHLRIGQNYGDIHFYFYR